MKIITEVLLVVGVVITTGCSNAVQEVKPVETECGACTGGSCEIPKNLAMKTPAKKNTYQPGFAAIPSVDQLIPAETANTVNVKNDSNALAGNSGHYNEVKLPGMAHKEVPQEQTFFVRTFKSDIWPGGIQLEAEIDPEVMNF